MIPCTTILTDAINCYEKFMILCTTITGCMVRFFKKNYSTIHNDIDRYPNQYCNFFKITVPCTMILDIMVPCTVIITHTVNESSVLELPRA